MPVSSLHTTEQQNGETEHQKTERMMARWTGRVGVQPERSRKNPVAPTAKPIGTMPDPLGPIA